MSRQVTDDSKNTPAGSGSNDGAQGNQGAGGDQGGQGNGQGAGGGQGAGSGAEHQVPKARLDDEARKRREAEQRAADLQKKIDDEAAERKRQEEAQQAEQGKFKDLATTRERERDDYKSKLEAETARTQKLDERLHNAVDAEIANWPEKLKSKIPVRDAANAETRAEKVDELRDLVPDFTAEKANNETAPKGAGIPPKPAGGADDAKADQEAKAASRRRFGR